MQPISAVIITYNEEQNIERCLASVAGLVKEILVVDSFSTDQTEAICRKYGVRFLQHPFEGFGQQKNRANAQAGCDWILSLDADEAVSPRLAEAIQKLNLQDGYDGYTMNRFTNYCGKWIRHSAWYPDKKLRLFNRRKAHWTTTPVHERLEISPDARVGHLEGHLLHYSYYTVDEHYQRAHKYANLAAHALWEKGKRATRLDVALRPAAKFIRNYIFHRGFLDGRAGFTICRIAALETYWKYSGLRNLSTRK